MDNHMKFVVFHDIHDLHDITAGMMYRLYWDSDQEFNYIIDDVGAENFAPNVWNDGIYTIIDGADVENLLQPIKSNGAHSTDFLKGALAVQEERAKEYEIESGEERSVEQLVNAFNAITRHKLTEQDGWLFLTLLKMVRAWNADNYHHDSALDMVSYSSLTAEALSRNKTKKGDE